MHDTWSKTTQGGQSTTLALPSQDAVVGSIRGLERNSGGAIVRVLLRHEFLAKITLLNPSELAPEFGRRLRGNPYPGRLRSASFPPCRILDAGPASAEEIPSVVPSNLTADYGLAPHILDPTQVEIRGVDILGRDIPKARWNKVGNFRIGIPREDVLVVGIPKFDSGNLDEGAVLCELLESTTQWFLL
jgi:hypothetical protein